MDPVTHAYGKKAYYTACLNVTDDLGGFGSACVVINVQNVVPTVHISAVPSTVNEGQEVTFNGYFDDPSWNDTHVATWDFGDGFKPGGSFHPGPGYGNTHHVMDPVTHAYGKKAYYTACLNVTDQFSVGSACTVINVQNVDPTVTANINTHTVREGLPFSVNGSFYDPSWNDTFNVVWNFGYYDNMTGRGPNYMASYWLPSGYRNTFHQVNSTWWVYGDDGNYTVYLNVTDQFNGKGSDSEYVVVQNVPPTVINVTAILHRNSPRTQGYWKYECTVTVPRQDHPGIRQEWVDAIRTRSTVFTDVHTKADVCAYLDPPKPQTPLKKAKMQMMALWLNVVSNLLFIDSPLHLREAPNNHSVSEFMGWAEWLIVHQPSDTNMNWVNTVATLINENAKGSLKDWGGIDPLVGEWLAYAMDPGTDDLMFVWHDSYYNVDTIHYKYNNGLGPEAHYNPATNRVRTPWGTYPFNTVDRLIVGYPKNAGTRISASLACLRDDDGGISPQANTTACGTYPWGSMNIWSPVSDGPVNAIDWSFNFTVSYRAIEGGFTIAEVTAQFISYDPLVVPRIEGGYIN
jgi:hypothetical protein